MTQNRNVNTVVGYQVNQSSVAAVQAANAAVAASFKDTNASAFQLSADIIALNPQLVALAGGAATVSAASATTTRALSAQAVEVQDLTALYAALDQQAQQTATSTAAAASGGGSAALAQNLFNARQAAIALPGVGYQSPLAVGIRGAELAVTQLGLGVAGLGALGLAVGGVAVGIAALVSSMQKGEEAANEYAASIQKTANEVGSGLTTEEANKRIDGLNREKDAINQNSVALETFQTYIRGAIRLIDEAKTPEELQYAQGLLAQSYSELSTATNGQVTNLDQLKIALNSNDEAIKGIDTATWNYIQAILNGVTAINDAAEAERQRAGEIVQNSQYTLDADRMTAEQRQQRIPQLEHEIELYDQLIEGARGNDTAVQALGDAQQKLIDQYMAITGVTRSYADQLADIASRAEAVDNLFDANTKLGEAMQRTADAQEKLAQSTTDHNAKLADIADQAREKEADARAKADEQRADVQDKAQKQAEEDERKHLQKVAEIEKDYARDSEAAVGNRDALALYKAKQKRDDDLSKEAENYAERQQQLKEHLDEQLSTIQKRLDDQLKSQQDAARKAEAAENASYARRQSDLLRALQNAQVEQNRAAGLALAYERQANDQQLNERIRANSVALSTTQAGNQQQQSAAVTHQNALINIAIVGGATVEAAFSSTMQNLARIAMLSSFVQNNPLQVLGAIGSGLFGSQVSTPIIQGMVDARMAQIIREANR